MGHVVYHRFLREVTKSKERGGAVFAVRRTIQSQNR